VSVLIWFVLVACAVAVWTDVSSRRIPNAITATLAAIALGFHALHGFAAFASAVGILIGVMLLGTLAFSMHWLGGGDVKLAAAAGAAFGYPDVLLFLIYTSLGGGILAVAYMAFRGRLGELFGNAVGVLRPFAYRGTVAVAPAQSTALPYACAIALGASAVALSHSIAPSLRLIQ
jgi:prepilin peptidase CpaA